MAAYNFKFYNTLTEQIEEFMFGNLDREVDNMQEALQDGFEQREFHNDNRQTSIEQIRAEIKTVKFDVETMTAVIVVQDDFIGEFKLVGTVEEI